MSITSPRDKKPPPSGASPNSTHPHRAERSSSSSSRPPVPATSAPHHPLLQETGFWLPKPLQILHCRVTRDHAAAGGALVLKTRPSFWRQIHPQHQEERSLTQMPLTALRDHQPPLGFSRSHPQELGTRLLLTMLEGHLPRLPPQPTHLSNLGNFHKKNQLYHEHPALSLVQFLQIINLFARVTSVQHLEQSVLRCESFG